MALDWARVFLATLVPGGVLTFPRIQQVLGQACRGTSLSRKQNAIFGLNSVVAFSKKELDFVLGEQKCAIMVGGRITVL